MQHRLPITIAAVVLVACGGTAPPKSSDVEPEPGASPAASLGAEPAAEPAHEPADAPEAAADPAPQKDSDQTKTFTLSASDTARAAQGATPSKIKATKTEAAIKFIVIDKDKGPIEGVVVSLTAPDGKKYYTGETDSQGYAEVLVPVGQKYDLVYLSLGRRDISAAVPVSDAPNQNIKLTLRYKRHPAEAGAESRFVLKGVNFDTGKATLRPESFPRLDSVLEYMAHKPSVRIEISGHTDNVGNPKANKALSEKRAQACRNYLISKGIDGSRIEAVGYGEERPVAPNETDEGRQENRRIEAKEL